MSNTATRLITLLTDASAQKHSIARSVVWAKVFQVSGKDVEIVHSVSRHLTSLYDDLTRMEADLSDRLSRKSLAFPIGLLGDVLYLGNLSDAWTAGQKSGEQARGYLLIFADLLEDEESDIDDAEIEAQRAELDDLEKHIHAWDGPEYLKSLMLHVVSVFQSATTTFRYRGGAVFSEAHADVSQFIQKTSSTKIEGDGHAETLATIVDRLQRTAMRIAEWGGVKMDSAVRVYGWVQLIFDDLPKLLPPATDS